MQPAQARHICDEVPELCIQYTIPRQFPWECRCPDLEIPIDFGIDDIIIIETIPGEFSDTLVIDKVSLNASGIAMPTNMTGTSIG
jgi:hypothetical protein